MDELNEPGFRAQQVFEALYRQRVSSAEQISTLPASLRRELDARDFVIGAPEIQSKFQSVDGTVRYLIACADGQTVETVWMPEGDGGEAGDGTEAGDEPARRWDRATICLKPDRVRVGYQFCLTALLGVKRNLALAKSSARCAPCCAIGMSLRQRPVNLVFMGMGEPSQLRQL
jgi:23S rRNA (adenine2503-C2)-methyltransferase